MSRTASPVLDRMRLLAAILVVAIHTAPLSSYCPTLDFWLTRVLARLAVPFFFMITGYFLAKNNWRTVTPFLKKIAAVYLLSVVLYLPLNIYSGTLTAKTALPALLVDGTFYHLWYLPAVLLGTVIAKQLAKLGLRAALPIAATLYLIGLGGDSYYGAACVIAPLNAFYKAFFEIFSYTRNGLFFAPLFLLLGAAGLQWKPAISAAGTLVSLLVMSFEAVWLHHAGLPRHDSMYLLLPICSVFLFSWLLQKNCGQNKSVRSIAALIYLLHPWCIVLVRGGAKLLHLEPLLIENSLIHFLAATVLSLGIGCLAVILRPRRLDPTSRAWKEVNLTALQHNAQVLQARAGDGCALMAVLKADAYGHGAVICARALQRAGIKAFAVACLSEAITLRKAGIRGVILVLGYTPPSQVALLHRWRITQSLVDASYAALLSAQNKRLHVHLALDTGMHRLGIAAEDMQAITAIYQLPNLQVDGIFSHLCVSDSLLEEDVAFTQRQQASFNGAVQALKDAGITPGTPHLLASSGLINLPPQPCGYVRCGIALYGASADSAPTRDCLDLWPVLSLKARIATVRNLRAGESAGYALAFQAQRPTQLAVATIGYGDGLPRTLPQLGAEALLHGQRVKMVGRMCMDQLLLDVTDLENVQPGDTITLIGRDGGSAITAVELAERCQTLSNELLSQLGAARLGLITQT